jgi:hypothetical protein
VEADADVSGGGQLKTNILIKKHMMTRFAQMTFGAVVAAAFAGEAEAALVNIASNSFSGAGRLVTTSDGLPLAFGSIVRIGTFPTGIPAATTFSAVSAAFVPIGESSTDANDGTNGPLTINDVNPSNPGAVRGHYAGTINAVQNSDPRFAAASRLYVFVLNAPPETMSLATEWAIFSDAAWTIPASGTRTMVTSAITDASEVFLGTYDGSNAKILMVPIPEPGVAMLSGVFGLVLLMGGRRRR